MAGIIDFNFSLNDDKGDVSFSNLVNIVRDVEDRKSKSLTQYLKRSMIASRVFIQREAADDIILPDLLLTIQNMYIGWILTAMQLNAYVDSTRTVRNALSVVATENLKEHVDTKELLMGLDTYGSYKHNTNGVTLSVIKENPSVNRAQGGSVLQIPPNINLPSGRIVEIKFNVGTDARAVLAIDVYVQLMPVFIPANVAEAFFMTNFKPSLAKRWFQATTGEIRFIKDFLFEMDLLKKRQGALKADKTGTLKEMYDSQKNSLYNYLIKLGGVTPERQNVANTVHIYEKSAFDAWCHRTGCDFRNRSHRDKFFSKTFSVMVAVIDSAYSRVDMYFHGIGSRAEYSFDQIKTQAKKETYDLKSIMQAYYTSSTPKF